MLTAKNNQGHLDEKQSYRFIPPNINIYYKVKIIKMVKWPEGRQIEQKMRSRKCVTKIPLIQREKTALSISGAGSAEYQYQVSIMM